MTDELSEALQAKPGEGEKPEAAKAIRRSPSDDDVQRETSLGSEATVEEKFEAYKKKTDAENRSLRRERNELREKVSRLETERDKAHEKLEATERQERDRALTKALGLDVRRAPLSAVKTVLEEAEIAPIYGEGGEVLNGAEMRNFLARTWTEKFGHGSSDGGNRQPRPGVAPATMSDYLRDEYRKVRGRSKRG
jgi:predicted RNase H-like nuclease (RuvC/YqgF family)